jgi:hypothetical protein
MYFSKNVTIKTQKLRKSLKVNCPSVKNVKINTHKIKVFYSISIPGEIYVSKFYSLVEKCSFSNMYCIFYIQSLSYLHNHTKQYNYIAVCALKPKFNIAGILHNNEKKIPQTSFNWLQIPQMYVR